MLEDKVLNTIKRYEQIKSGDTIVVGVSGGPDSICLLNVLKNLQNELKINIVVAHINHMIRKEADSETEFVQDFCEQRDMTLPFLFQRSAQLIEFFAHVFLQSF